MPSSSTSSTCHIEWRPSRLLAVALGGLGVLACCAFALSSLPWTWAVMGGLLAMAHAVVLARRHLRQPAISLCWAGPGEPALIGQGTASQRLDAVRLHLRGPLAVLEGVDAQGRRQRWHWYPDTLPAADQRRLRLVAMQPRRGRPAAATSLPILLS